MGWTVITLPFGADRDAKLLELVASSFGGRARESSAKVSTTSGPSLAIDQRIIVLTESRGRARVVKRLLAREMSMAPAGYYGTVDDVVLELVAAAVFPPSASSLGHDALGYVCFPTDMQSRRLIRDGMFASDALTSRTSSTRSIDEMATALARVRNTLAPQTRLPLLDALRSILGKADPGLASRVRAVRDVLAHHQSGLSSMGRASDQWIVDEGDAEWLAAAYPAEVFSNIGLVIADDIYRMGPAQQAFLAAAAEHCSAAVWLSRSSAKDSPQERVLATSPIRHLVTPERLTSSNDSTRAVVIDALLHGKPVANSHSADTSLTIARYASPVIEARTTVARAKALHVLNHVPLNNIGICLVDKEDEETMAVELEAAGVPYARSAPLPILHAPAVQALCGLADVAADGWPFEATLGVLRSPWLAGLAEHIEGSSRRSWEYELSRLAFAARSDSNLAPHLLGGTGRTLRDWQPALDRNIGSTNPINPWQRWEVVFGILDRLTSARSTSELAAALVTLARESGAIHHAGSQRKLAHFAADSHLDGSRMTWNTDCLAKLIHTLVEEGAEPEARAPTLAAAWADLRDAVTPLQCSLRKAEQAIQLLGLLDVRGQAFDHLFICGLHAAAMPFPDPENAFFQRRIREVVGHGNASDEVRSAVESLAADVNPLDEYRHLLACAISNAPGSITLSWPFRLAEGEVAPSLPLRELMAAIGIEEESKEDTENRNTPPTAAANGARLSRSPAAGIVEPSTGESREYRHFSPRDLHLASGKSVTKAISDIDGAKIPLSNLGPATEVLQPGLLGAAVNVSRDELLNFASPWAGKLQTDAGKEIGLPRPRVADSDGNAPVRAVSPSRVEHYAQCPARYLYQDVIRIEEPDVVSEGLDVMGRGSLVHSILEAFLLKLRVLVRERCANEVLWSGRILDWPSGRTIDEGSDPEDYRRPSRPSLTIDDLPLIDIVELEKHGVAVEDVMREVLAEHADHSPSIDWLLWVRREQAALDGNGQPSVLAGFVAHERMLQQGNEQGHRLVPWLMEYHIGTGDRPWFPPLLEPERLKSLQGIGFTGKVDRIDLVIEGEGPNAKILGLVIRDYKASGGYHGGKLKSGVAFQLPVYARAASERLSGDNPLSIEGFFIHVTKEPARKKGELGPVQTDARFYKPYVKDIIYGDGNRNRVQGDPSAIVEHTLPIRLTNLLGAMENGFFHPELVSGSGTACKYCHLTSVCAVRTGQQDLLQTAGLKGALSAAEGGFAPYFPTEADLKAPDHSDDDGEDSE